MEHDEHEMLVEYSEMTAFDFNSREFQEVRRDYLQCKSMISRLAYAVGSIVNGFKPAKNY